LRYRVIDLMMKTIYQNPAPVREAASHELAKMKDAGIDTVGMFREAALKEIARCNALAKAQAQAQPRIG